MKPRLTPKEQSLAVWAIRIIVGATFIVSGFAKVIDPWGTIYKIEQYLSVWGYTVPRTVTITSSVALAAGEFAMGMLLLLGCFRRTVAYLLILFMAFMLPLTAYIAIANPVSDCGCFGDLITLSNPATLIKNIILTALIIPLLALNSKVRGLYRPSSQWLVATIVGAWCLTVALLGYNVQPLLDFRPYPVGSMLTADDPDDNLSGISFIYEKNGEQKKFAADEIPDSSWTFVTRLDAPTLTAQIPSGLALYDEDEDVTADVLTGQGLQLLALIPDILRADISYTYLLNELNSKIKAEGGEMAAVIATNAKGIDYWNDVAMPSYPLYTSDNTSIKEIARGNIALVLLDNGKIVWKRSIWSLPPDISAPITSFTLDSKAWLVRLSLIPLAALAAVWLLQSAIATAHRRIVAHRNRLLNKQ